jgi:hypothetical protein
VPEPDPHAVEHAPISQLATASATLVSAVFLQLDAAHCASQLDSEHVQLSRHAT